MLKRVVRFGAVYWHGACHALNVFSIGLRSSQNRVLVNQIAAHSGYRTVAPKIPEISPDELAQSDTPMRMLSLEIAEGNVNALELAIINKLTADRSPRKAFEFGTFDGRTTLNLAANCGGTIYTLDLPADKLDSTALRIEPADEVYVTKDFSGSRFAGNVYSDRIVQLYGDSATFDYSPYLGSMDLVFVDASHSYEYLMSDNRNALKLLAPRGVILWHDYAAWDGVTRALNELSSTGTDFRGLRWIKAQAW
jgi:predicted O-methyltransferase YrrM